ncbi:abscisic acid 8'-hydroxylase 2 isoform X3 [Typha latifolia]|uniref:abscisic acid 8'-hydroxylase 2 isoform X3 n=1 Tax=Typha latifolia TaxID=4733 RepID=UPI003C2E031B
MMMMMMMMMIALYHSLLLLPFFQLLFLALLTYLVREALKSLANGSRMRRVSCYPPGSSGLPWIGETVAFIAASNSSKGFYEFVRTRHLWYGDCFRTNILGETHVFVSSTEVAKALLGSESFEFSKRYIRSIAELLGDESLLCLSHDHHKFLRRHISNLFTLDSLASSVKIFDKLVIDTMGEWKEKECVVVVDVALKITFNAICKMLISLDEEDKLEVLRKDVFEVSEALLAFPLRLPGTRFYKGLQARKRIMNVLRKEIALRRESLECHKDFLQNLLEKDKSESDESLTDAQILDNILTLIIAGQVTTASAITWMIKYLDENKEVQETLRYQTMQLEHAMKNSGLSLPLEALNEMQYASKIVKECLRMATIVSWFPRVALKDCQIEGFQIRKGWIVNVDARSIHYDSKVYDDPMEFKPSRFDEDPKPYSFLAFGAGGRICLGMNLAKAMMLVFLHRFVTSYRWRVTDEDTSLQKWAMFPRLRSGCPISVTPV